MTEKKNQLNKNISDLIPYIYVKVPLKKSVEMSFKNTYVSLV